MEGLFEGLPMYVLYVHHKSETQIKHKVHNLQQKAFKFVFNNFN
ncbi:hypothetical protein ADICYQ_3031 [Cyclobacterium qasimii M12-11B]|uniref:Uncharacterized protein n=1 Tax=Cyclobacterium qasimii M12-11B TaxID=641524 RepID=S7WMJ9_9BACT|nr:hypothetical protein ADICYQ_3031 [Cyclobacterium qasimii M12-11B]